MEQQLYGSSSRSREEDSRVVSGKQRSLSGAGAAGCTDIHGTTLLAWLRRASQGCSQALSRALPELLTMLCHCCCCCCCAPCVAAANAAAWEEHDPVARRPRRSDDGRGGRLGRSNSGGNNGTAERQGLRGLFFNILRSRCAAQQLLPASATPARRAATLHGLQLRVCCRQQLALTCPAARPPACSAARASQV